MELNDHERKVLTLIDCEAVDGFSEWAAEELNITFEDVENIVDKLLNDGMVTTAPDDEEPDSEELYYFRDEDVSEADLDASLLHKHREEGK
ncbi:MAG: hypothetical protein A3B06_03900 [Candidatus Yonathbacteria bacterium RIFCSPLOWO2_01_FULL_43_20]|nr:MAG: hypothetical protein A3B06_03900 [Candidatus Yonathbacteria bacterium RIFCSPLOWO2_01_FULL_43_20]